MFHLFPRKQLERRGFSTGQKRRQVHESAISGWLKSSWQVCGLLFVAFAALVSIWIIVSSSEASFFGNNTAQAFIVVGVISATLVIHWHVSLPDTFRRNSTIALMLSIVLVQLLLVKLSEHVAMTFAPSGGFRFLVEPYIFAPMVLSLLVGRRHGTFAVVYASLFGAMTVAEDEAFLFVIFSLICGFVAIYLTGRVRRRSRLVVAGIYSGLACVFLALSLGQILVPGLGDETATWQMFARQALSALLVSTLTAVLVSGLLPILEMTFRITTEVSWMELADLNHPLLKQMTIEAPGTYHHSLVVATLAERAAEEVEANAIMCRVCSYFHDIGKMKKPIYFVENIGDASNPHDELTPSMSAIIIIAHVKDGVDMAMKHKLNPEIVAVIREHHGTSVIRFFYHRALKLRDEIQKQVDEGKAHEEDVPEVSEEHFRYAGPRPRTRESAIISLADSVESASRSLQKPTPKKIDELIEGIFRDRLNDGQLDEAALTLADLATIKRSFSATLRSMMHTRIAYPKAEEVADQVEKSKKRAAKKGNGDSGKPGEPPKESGDGGDAAKRSETRI